VLRELRRQSDVPVVMVTARVCYDDLCCDRGTREATRDGRRIELTATEFRPAGVPGPQRPPGTRPGSLVARGMGYDSPVDSNVVDVHIGHLRRKIGDPPVVQTVRGVGYVLRSGP
jgi:two-component system OmpR family response regulator